MDEQEYKRAKEEFVANLTGTTMSEIFLVLLVLPGALWLYYEFVTFFESMYLFRRNSNLQLNLYSSLRFGIEFIIVVGPLFVCFTCTDVLVPMLVVIYCAASVLAIVTRRTMPDEIAKLSGKLKLDQLLEKEVAFLTCFRALMMLCTCIAILAVDFHVFPRRFAKTETFGTSIMDIGVGAFMMSSGITSKSARKGPCGTPSNSPAKESTQSMVKRMKSFLRPMAPVIGMGLLRLFTLKNIDYQEHASEYGVHWNFYFTLAAVYFLYNSLSCLSHSLVSYPAAILFLTGYQVALSCFGLENFILNAERVTFLSMNREGICSSIGYLVLYVISAEIGKYFFFSNGDSIGRKRNASSSLSPKRKLVTKKVEQVMYLAVIDVFCWMLCWVLSSLLSEPSRRMMNAPYVAWILAQGIFLLITLMVIHLLCMSADTPYILQSISKSQLFIFLVANVITGLVNISMKTLFVEDGAARIILLAYIGSICALAMIMHVYGVTIKL